MKRKYLFFVSILIINTTYSQEFELTEKNTASYFTIDKFKNEVYISPWFSTLVGKYNMNTGEHVITEFPSFPVFMYNSHKAIYLEVSDSSNIYYLYDFETNTSRIVWEYKFKSNLNKLMLAWNPHYKISPNDSLVFIGSPKPIYDTVNIKSTQDFIMFGEDYPYCWSSDSTIIFKSLDHSLAEYYAYSTKIDTLIDMGKGNDIVSFDYNIKENLLAYSVGRKFYIYDSKNKEELFQYENSDCTFGWIEFEDIMWNEEETKLAFFGKDYTNPISSIYMYSLDSEKITQVTNCDYYGLKAHLKWLNNDSILYIDVAEDRLLGFDITEALTNINEKFISPIPKEYTLNQNYPNPFNPSTTIEYSIPSNIREEELNTKLEVFDILAQKVITLVNKEQSVGNYKVEFDANSLPSGVYFYRLKRGNFSEIKKMILLR